MTRLDHYLFLGGNNGSICYIALSGKWVDIAYWTISGAVQHQESVDRPTLFQTFTVHTSPITKWTWCLSRSGRSPAMSSQAPPSSKEPREQCSSFFALAPAPHSEGNDKP
ncbi:hypothetical protein LSAT2_017789 [Lamellibrachia satsuma]|nr:hypothetical protein LSAT2_017789 [Lamellibrachia satsuma]